MSWGGKGTGATGHRLESEFYDDDTQAYLEPKPIRDLVGEEVNQVTGTVVLWKVNLLSLHEKKCGNGRRT